MLVSKDFTFDAAHFLTRYRGKCEHLHGHTYRLRVTVEGKVQKNGLVLDFGILKKIVKEQVLNKYDHRSLNDFFENPSAEVVAEAIWGTLKDLPHLLKGEKEVSEQVRLYEIVLWETRDNFVTYRGK